MSVDTQESVTRNRSSGADESRGRSPVRFVVEAMIGAALAGAVALAVLASTGEIPFVYQGY